MEKGFFKMAREIREKAAYARRKKNNNAHEQAKR